MSAKAAALNFDLPKELVFCLYVNPEDGQPLDLSSFTKYSDSQVAFLDQCCSCGFIIQVGQSSFIQALNKRPT